MKKKSVPCIVMLVAGLASCLISISQQVDTMEFTERLLSTLVIFYILGFIIKLILDKAMKNLSSAKEDENEKDISEADKQEEDGEEEKAEEEEKSQNDDKKDED